jgi:hypothetical protein
MRLPTLIKLLALGLGTRAIVRGLREQRARAAARRGEATRAGMFAPDPTDPLQSERELAELMVDPLDVDVRSLVDVEAAQDLAGLESAVESPRDEGASGGVFDTATVGVASDAGDLYGAHTPRAVDRLHVDDDRAFDEGQNWLEALETSAIEYGAEPERELDEIVDDEDVLRPPHASDHRDTPIADHGSGGRRGL